ENGFDFKDDYAQCVLKKVLNDRPRLFYDPTACDSERVISPYVDLLITEPNAPDNTDNSAYSQVSEMLFSTGQVLTTWRPPALHMLRPLHQMGNESLMLFIY